MAVAPTAFGVIVITFLGGSAAQAAFVETPGSATISYTPKNATDPSPVSIDVNGDGTLDAQVAYSISTAQLTFTLLNEVSLKLGGGFSGSNASDPPAITLYQPGGEVTPTGPFFDGISAAGTAFSPKQYVGVAFADDMNNLVLGQFSVFLKLSQIKGNPSTFTFSEYGYEAKPEKSLTITAVPEPATLSAIALGGAFLFRRRRRI